MKSTQFVIFTDESVGNAGSGTTLSVIFRQLMVNNGIDETILNERLRQLVAEFPSTVLEPAAFHQHVLAALNSDVMSWEVFMIGMKIIGAETVTLTIR